jgi:hypothetical protein
VKDVYTPKARLSEATRGSSLAISSLIAAMALDISASCFSCLEIFSASFRLAPFIQSDKGDNDMTGD